ncbi:MAG: LAGLIDADG family homing endonuclease, partial [Chloroflexota bacterium]
GIVPGSLALIGGDPGIGKCVVGPTRILDPISGAYLPITEWVTERRPVLSLDYDTHNLSPQPVAAFYDRGVQRIVEVTTRLGRVLRCTPNHPVLTPDGWTTVGDLPPGARIAAPRELPYFGHDPMGEHEIKLIAYALSDGAAVSAVSVTNALPEVGRDLVSIAHEFGLQLRVYSKPNTRAKQFRFVQPLGQRADSRKEIASALNRVKSEGGMSWAGWARTANVSYGMLNVWKRGECAPSVAELQQLAAAAHVTLETLAPNARDQADMQTSVARLLESVGLRFVTAETKAIPDCIFRLPRAQLTLFLKTLFSCDGSVYVNRRAVPGISYSTISRRLAEDVQHVLLRFGFVTRLRTKNSQVNAQPYTAYEIQLLGVAEVKRFLVEIGIYGRAEAIARIMAMPLPQRSSTRSDTIPTGAKFWGRLRAVTAGASFKSITRKAGVKLHYHRADRPLCRSTVAALAAAYPSPDLQRLAHGEVYWDEIQSITSVGEERVYDLSVPPHANFVANDLIVHNSTLLLQVAALMADNIGTVLYV